VIVGFYWCLVCAGVWFLLVVVWRCFVVLLVVSLGWRLVPTGRAWSAYIMLCLRRFGFCANLDASPWLDQHRKPSRHNADFPDGNLRLPWVVLYI